jgi:hypothetical protein
MRDAVPALDDAGLRRFGWTTGASVAVVFGMLLPWLFGRGWPWWPWVAAALLWVPALAYPRALGPVYTGWMRFALVIGFINTRLILGGLFFLVFTPVGLLLRLLGSDPMRRKVRGQGSYRVSSKVPLPNHVERPF